MVISPEPSEPALARTFGLIIDGLRRALAARMPSQPKELVPLLIFLWSRLHRMAARFASLAARAQAGPLTPPRRRLAPPKSRPRPPQRLSRQFAWLVRLAPEAACFGSQLQHLFSDPEMQKLLAAAPQAGRILRPLCRMLAIPVPPSLRLPPRPVSPRRAAPEPPGQALHKKPQPPPDKPVVVWRRWRGIRMPEILRPPRPA